MNNITKEQLKKTLPKIKKGLELYLWIQSEVPKRDISKDREFQRKFNAFYKVRRNQTWQKDFYELLEVSKKGEVSFEDILNRLHKKTGKIEASFSSKLVATINPTMPVIDTIVFKNLGLKLPLTNTKNRVAVINELYQVLIQKFFHYLKSDDGKHLTVQFKKEYPKAKISKVKMLDFVLWQMRG